MTPAAALPMALVGASVAAIAEATADDTVSQIISAGGKGSLAVVLFWGLLQFMRGNVVSRDVAAQTKRLEELDTEYAELLRLSAEREARYLAIVDKLMAQLGEAK